MIRRLIYRWRHRAEIRALRAELARLEAQIGPAGIRLAAAYLMASGYSMQPPPPMGAWLDAYNLVILAATTGAEHRSVQ